jgi:uncharacterized protein YcnI
MNRLRVALAASGAVALLVVPRVVSAHTESDVVAVPAGSEATVTLEPTHGCADSPTVRVRIRAPLEDAEAVAVEGWEESSEPDDEGNTILTWEGGVLPADEPGAFPVTFTAPDTVGELLIFPSVQECENGEDLAWIDGDPEAEFAAPRLLILEADAEPAATIDDVPEDAPGREQLVEIVDVDNPTASSLPATPTSEQTRTATTV